MYVTLQWKSSKRFVKVFPFNAGNTFHIEDGCAAETAHCPTSRAAFIWNLLCAVIESITVKHNQVKWLNHDAHSILWQLKEGCSTKVEEEGRCFISAVPVRTSRDSGEERNG